MNQAIENLEVTKLYYTIRDNEPNGKVKTKLIEGLLKWQNSKVINKSGSFYEPDDKIYNRYVELRNKYLGGESKFASKYICYNITKWLFTRIPATFASDPVKGKEYMRIYTDWYRKFYEPNEKKFHPVFAKMIVTDEQYEMIENLKRQMRDAVNAGEYTMLELGQNPRA